MMLKMKNNDFFLSNSLNPLEDKLNENYSVNSIHRNAGFI